MGWTFIKGKGAMGQTLDQVMDALPEERRLAIETRAEELLAEVEGLPAGDSSFGSNCREKGPSA
jgi:hypothetical protein